MFDSVFVITLLYPNPIRVLLVQPISLNFGIAQKNHVEIGAMAMSSASGDGM